MIVDQQNGGVADESWIVAGQPLSPKAPDAFRTIGEVASDLAVPQHVLRFWEGKFSQIRPMKRSGGRRYYRPEDVALLADIKDMLYGRGFTIRGVQKILKDGRKKALAVESDAVYSDGETQSKLSSAARRDLDGVLGELVSMRELLRSAGV